MYVMKYYSPKYQRILYQTLSAIRNRLDKVDTSGKKMTNEEYEMLMEFDEVCTRVIERFPNKIND